MIRRGYGPIDEADTAAALLRTPAPYGVWWRFCKYYDVSDAIGIVHCVRVVTLHYFHRPNEPRDRDIENSFFGRVV
jgi:hypothetical protein